MLWPKRVMSKGKALSALVLILVGFLAIAGLYMNLKGAVFSKKKVGQFTQSLSQQEVKAKNNRTISKATHTSRFTSSNIAKALGKLVNNTGETLMWFFLPALLIGMHKWFKEQKWHEPESFFVTAIIALNIPLMIWLYCKHGYMSNRHTLSLLIIPILFVPVGLQELVIWYQKLFSKRVEPSMAIKDSERFWFLLLLVVGVSICTPKLFRPIRTEKQGYRAAAQWLEANTDSTAIIAVPDKRISFYAQRKGLIYSKGIIPPSAAYIVDLSQKDFKKSTTTEMFHQHIDRKNSKANFEVYRNLQPKM